VKQTQHGNKTIRVIVMVIMMAGGNQACLHDLRAEIREPEAGTSAATERARAASVETTRVDPRPTDIRKKLFSGRVVLAQEALKRRGIKVAEEMKSQVVLETHAGRLIAIAADWRGRALFQDKRLRNRKIELVGYRRPEIPYLQVLIIYIIDEKGRRQEMDYWCDICAIPMYEIKACECCQGDILLRLRPGKLPSYLTHPELSGDRRTSPQPPRKPGGNPGT